MNTMNSIPAIPSQKINPINPGVTIEQLTALGISPDVAAAMVAAGGKVAAVKQQEKQGEARKALLSLLTECIAELCNDAGINDLLAEADRGSFTAIYTPEAGVRVTLHRRNSEGSNGSNVEGE